MLNQSVLLVVGAMALAVAGWVAAAAPPAIAWLPLAPGSAAECPVRFHGNVREVAAGIGRSALFSGARDDLASFDAPTFSNLTVAAWVKMDGLGQGDKPYPRIVETPGFYLHLTDNQSGVALAGLTLGTQVNGGVSAWSVAEVVPTGRWAHVAVSCPGGGVGGVPTFYVNGRRLAGGLAAKTLPAVFRGGKAAFGNSPGGARPLQGALADVRLYDALLTPAAVAALAQRTPDGNVPVEPQIVYRDELPIADISGWTQRQTVIAAGTPSVYQRRLIRRGG